MTRASLGVCLMCAALMAWSTPRLEAHAPEQPVHQRPSFQLMGLGLALLVSAMAVRSYVGAQRRRADELERAVTDRTADLSVARERLTAANDSLVTAKQEVEQAHGQVLAILNQLDIGVLLLSEAGNVRYASAAAQRVLQKDEPSLLGRSWWTCLPLVESDRARVNARVEASAAGEERVPVQLVIGGVRYWTEIDVRDEPPPGNGRILYMYGTTELAVLSAKDLPHDHDGLVGRSTGIHLMRRQIRDVARVDATVLIAGETGVGKELVARAIHRASQRAGRPFVAVNAAGLTESLLASQLFGHRRGAFTGAVDDHPGVFEAASGGTLFLDEIGDMPPSVQASLLRVLQEREITRLGESMARRVDVRFVAATHRDLRREVEEGRFRDDLFYRVRVATILVPPLRDRIDDVPLLVHAFLAQAAGARRVADVSRDAMDALLRYRWPGNVRELKAVIEWALVDAAGDGIRLENLPAEVVGRRRGESVEPPAGQQSDRDRLLDALRRANGNRARAARLLGIGRTTLYKRLAEYGLERNA